MSEQPFFSVIIPTYNRASVLGSAIKSVLSQSYEDFELLVIDDGSTDNTLELFKDFPDSRLRYFRQENKGVSSARNKGAMESRGHFLIFLDSDDSCTNKWLEDFIRIIKIDDCCIAYCDVLKIATDNSRKISSAKNPYGKGNNTGIDLPGSWTVSRTVFFEAGMYDEKIRFGENNELRLRMNKIIRVASFVSQANFIYYESNIGGSKNNYNKLYSLLYILRKHKNYYDERVGTHKRFLRTAAVAAARIGRYRTARIIFMRSLRLDYFDIKSWLQYLISINKYICKLKWA